MPKHGKHLTKSKACEILSHGEVHGHKLTPKQRRFMGAKASGKAARRDGGRGRRK